MKNLKIILIIMLMACARSIVYGEPANQKPSKTEITLKKSNGYGLVSASEAVKSLWSNDSDK